MAFIKRFVPSPSMAVALAALVVAASGLAVAATGGFVGSSGEINACVAGRDLLEPVVDLAAPITQVAVKAGTMRVVKPGESCRSGEIALPFNQTGPAGPAGAGSEGATVRAASTRKAVKVGANTTAVLRKTLPAGAFLVSGKVGVVVPEALEEDQLLRCFLAEPDGDPIASSIVTESLAAGEPGLKVTIPVSAYISEMPGGNLTLQCKRTLVTAPGSEARAANIIDDIKKNIGDKIMALEAQMAAQQVAP